ncbi:MAG: nucleotide exchange factor GrpE [Planctomycetes bacterium]|nr:nucleotide exchange factor GrpE [Planctomycetota bacterium]MBL7185982.1 nucleotide exchange factor GrpE [Phycisphaerae bacterium]
MTDSESQVYPVSDQDQPRDDYRERRAHVRERILRRFELWLDEILDGEQPIEGISAEILEQLQADTPAEGSGETEAGCDLYALWSAVTTMTEETRLQGRAFKQLHDGLSPMEEMVGSVAAMLGRYQAALDLQEQKTNETWRQAAWKDILETLIDMRDRLIRGAESARTWIERPEPVQESGFLRRIRGRLFARQPDIREQQRDEVVRSLLKGYTLCQEVLDDAFAQIGVRPMDCLGQPFDPVTMKAVDIACESDVPDDTVLEVYRQGYWWGETAYRPAEVKVAAQRQQAQQDQQSVLSGQGGQYES